MDDRPLLLLHSCCAPCSTAVISQLYDSYNLAVYFYNPNIMPAEEYEIRREAQRRFIDAFDREKRITLYEGAYNVDDFVSVCRGLENEPEGGLRCTECFKMRLRSAASMAKEIGADCFTTTLTVSPHKNAELINLIGEELSAEYGIPWLCSNFKKRNGFLNSIRLSKEYGLYRQNYCGCIFSCNDIK